MGIHKFDASLVGDSFTAPAALTTNRRRHPLCVYRSWSGRGAEEKAFYLEGNRTPVVEIVLSVQ
jgi:hypothetical protein